MYQPFKKGDKVVVRLRRDREQLCIPVIGIIEYAHPKYGWCTCNLGPYSTSYWNEKITLYSDWPKTEKRPVDLSIAIVS